MDSAWHQCMRVGMAQQAGKYDCPCGHPLTQSSSLLKHVRECWQAHSKSIHACVLQQKYALLLRLGKTKWPDINSQLDQIQHLVRVIQLQGTQQESPSKSPHETGDQQVSAGPNSQQQVTDEVQGAQAESPQAIGPQAVNYNVQDFIVGDDEPTPQRGVGKGGNRQLAALRRKLYKETYTIKDMQNNDRVHRGPILVKFVMQFLDWKAMSNTSDKAADMILKLYNREYIRCKHSFPRSWGLLTRIAGPREHSTLKRIMCRCNNHFWRPVPKSQKGLLPAQATSKAATMFPEQTPSGDRKRKRFVMEYQCPECDQPRFQRGSYRYLNETGVSYYYWGIQESIQELFKQDEWSKHFQVNTQSLPYFDSPEFKRLAKALQQLDITDLSKCVFIDIGHDGFQPFKNTDHRSTWGWWMRVKNACPSVQFRYMNVRELMLVPQAKRARYDQWCSNIPTKQAFVQLVEELQSLYKQPLTVYNAHTMQEEQYYVILSSLMADTPGRAKVSESGGSNAVFCCQWCVTEGQPYTTQNKAKTKQGKGTAKTTLYPAGYVDPQPIERYKLVSEHVPLQAGERNVPVCYAGENRSKLTHKQQMERMDAAENSGIEPPSERLKHFGIKGHDIFTNMLPYVLYNNLFVVPTYHCLLYGVMKRFWTMALKRQHHVVDKKSEDIMKARASGMVGTDDFNARYSCIVQHKANWKLYDWHSWADVWANFILHGITLNGQVPTRVQMPPLPQGYTPPNTFTEVVHRMHAACTYFLRVQPEEEQSLMWHYYTDLYIFAQSVELTFGVGPALTSNLHMAVCRLADQCLSRGHTGYEGEIWIERSVQVCTRVLADATAIDPEGLMAKRLCYDDAIVNLQRDTGFSGVDVTCNWPTFEKDKQEKNFIRQPGSQDVYLCGKPVNWSRIQSSPSAPPDVSKVLSTLLRHKNNVSRLTDAHAFTPYDPDCIQPYPRAEVDGAFIVRSQLVTKARMTESYWVMLYRLARGCQVHVIGAVQYFFRAGRPDQNSVEDNASFYAVVRCYRTQVIRAGHVNLYVVRQGEYDSDVPSQHEGLKIVQVSDIQAKVHRFYDVTAPANRVEATEWLFQEYYTTSLR